MKLMEKLARNMAMRVPVVHEAPAVFTMAADRSAPESPSYYQRYTYSLQMQVDITRQYQGGKEEPDHHMNNRAVKTFASVLYGELTSDLQKLMGLIYAQREPNLEAVVVIEELLHKVRGEG